MKSCKKCYSRGYNADFSTGVRLKIKCEICNGIGCIDWVAKDHARDCLILPKSKDMKVDKNIAVSAKCLWR